MSCQAPTTILSASTQTWVSSLADEYGARELWLFGSAAMSPYDEKEPSDIDIAVLGVPRSAKAAFTRVLKESFPLCRVDEFNGYTVGSVPRTSSPPLHFVLAGDSRHDYQAHPMSRSIRKGICLWRAK